MDMQNKFGESIAWNFLFCPLLYIVISQEICSIMELVGPIIDVLKCLGDPTCRYIDHHRKLEERMNDLRAREGDLNIRRRDIELTIKAELRWGKIVKGEVEKWLLDVQEVNKKIQAMYQRAQNVSCFSRACLGKRVAEIIELVQKTIERGKFTGALVIDNLSTAGVAAELEYLEGETIVKEEIWNYLMGNEIGMIGVCGMGGMGKTTVMKHIYNQLLKETRALFANVIWVTVSKELNTTKVQQVIANALNIASLPEPEQERERVAVLMEELGKRRYVLILDDVWEKFSLLALGIPQPTSRNGSKLVLTSRSIDVCVSMGYKIVKVQPLSNEESMNLFLEHVGRGVLEVPSLKEILGHIVQECDGLPLAIVVLAGSMKGIYDVHEWRNALRELREHIRSVKGTEEEIYERLKFSYDRLGDSQIQNCFLYCSLYPEDFVISRAELIEYWIDDGFLGIGSRQELYDRGHTILNRLENNCLLEKVDDGNVKMHDVLRDMALYIKDRRRFMVKAGLGLRELPSKQEWAADLEKVSLMRNDISEFPPDLSPNCKILSTLLLQENKNLQRIPELFFQHMHGLCILDLSYTNIEQLPDSVSNLEKLNALVLFGCYKLRYVPSLEKLKALRKLDLCYTAIEKVPDGLEMLVNLTYLNLYAECLKELPIAILPKLSCLQYLVLYVESSTLKINGSDAARLTKLEMFEGRFNELMDFNTYSKSIQGQRRTSYLLVMAPFEAKFDATTLEVERSSLTYAFRLVSCNELNHTKALKTLESITGKKYVAFEGAEKELMRVVGAVDPTEIVKKMAKIGVKALRLKLPYLLPKKDVILSGCPIGREDPVALPSDLRCLRIFECHNVRSLSDISFFQQTNELRFCSIHDCRGIESVLDLSSSPSPCTPFQNLELLWLEKLDNLRMLVKVEEACVVSRSSSLMPLPGVFCHLKSFQIEGCSNMKQLFPFELRHGLQNLEKLVVDNCGQMKEIIASEEEEENGKGKGTYSPTMFTLPKLMMLELKNLPELKSICSSNSVMTCDSLQDIEVWKCPNLKRMPLYLPIFQDNDQQASHPFKRIRVYPKEWWKSVEWDYPSAKNVLQPWLVLG
ncbi:putative disease resistance protein At4g10780 [Durio zibethinus]|uniref:Disease resistance protein At4g10780 n=1 Tax=Durio zibethinus TaxID=66656 RepID=A0A6P5WND7_DURZI|nr:putative disease resistance protein At4g10780 [Durio zibethinus]